MLEWKKIYYFRKNYVKFRKKYVKFRQKYVILGKNMLKWENIFAKLYILF